MRNDGPNGTSGWSFTSLNTLFAPTEHAQSSWADYDGDQDLDLLLVNISPLYDDGFIRRYRNDGNGIFTGEDILGTLSVEQGEAQWGDYDGDGDLDILVAGNVKELNGTYTPLTLRIYRNDIDTYFPIEVIVDPYSEGWFDFTAATWADYDSDGDMDILVAGNYNSGTNIEGRARIYSNTNGVFTDSGNELPSPRAAGDRGGTFSWLDIDNDGDLDYFIAGQYFVPGGNGLVEAQMHVYRNDVTGQNDAPSSPTGLQDGDYNWTIRAVDAAYLGSSITTGVFTIGTQTSIEETDNLAQIFSLAQNYPNPFSSTTIIKFTLSEQENVVIKVFNVLGDEIKTIVNKEFAQGQHEVVFNAAGLSSGAYFYKITSGNNTIIKKMQVL